MPDLAPASASPLLRPSLPVTPTARESATSPSLDDKVEVRYLDLNGVPRRSDRFTLRMVMDGDTIEDSTELDASEQAHELAEMRDEEKRLSALARQEAERELEAKQKLNAEFKHKCKEERSQWISEANELIETRLQLWYDGKNVDDQAVDVTETNTAVSPSKKAHAFIDSDGNLRRKSALQVEVPGGLKVDDGGDSLSLVDAIRPADTTTLSPPPAPVQASS